VFSPLILGPETCGLLETSYEPGYYRLAADSRLVCSPYDAVRFIDSWFRKNKSAVVTLFPFVSPTRDN
jgi:hypothetical protein